MDIVYIVRAGEENEELRYSLRSIANLEHGEVYMLGGPSWVRNVKRLEFTEAGKWKSLHNAIAAASEHLSRFWLFNDDFFCMYPTSEIDVVHRGPLDPGRKAGGGSYGLGRRRAYAFLVAQGIENPRDYEVHIPMLIDAKRMRACLERLGTLEPWGYLRTIYGNLWGIGGVLIEDPKYGITTEPPPRRAFLSTYEGSFRHGYIGDVIRARFPTPSRYEG